MTLEELAPRVLSALGAYGGKRLMAAVSGGADSVALLETLALLRETERGLAVEAAHVEHGLRGAESQGDAEFVYALCRRLDIPLTMRSLSPPPGAGETWAREARYAALMQAVRDRQCDALVLAHHRDDQAETVLEHLLRGCGPEGMAGMRAVSRRDGCVLLRPLLTFSRAELREALTHCGEAWREDSSNARADCLRNRLRLELLPAMEGFAPHAGEHIAALAELAAEEQDMLAEHASAFLTRWGGTANALPVAALKAEHPAMRKRILRAWWGMTRPMLDRAHTESLAALTEAAVGARCMLPCGVRGERGYRFVHLVDGADKPSDVCAPLPTQGGVTLGGMTLTIAPWQEALGTGDGKRCQAFPKAALTDCVLRRRRAGDIFRPFGASGHKKLQDELVDRRVDAAFRDRVPLLCRGNEVLWIGGVSAGEAARIGAREDAAWLRFTGDMPWGE